MQQYKIDFIEFMVRSSVLTFGNFVTKSGRKTPFFINTGKYRTGEQISRLGLFYAQAIKNCFQEDISVLFGPAYKGIPLVVTTAIALNDRHNTPVSFCFNRKEAKDHGEGGTLIGHRLADGDSVLIVEDVTTAGTSVRESVPLLQSFADIHLAGLIVSVDRMERGNREQSALTELSHQFNMPAHAIVTMDEVITYLYNRPIDGTVILDRQIKKAIEQYYRQYGV